jgi:uracil phosphoribosyltransferase
MLHHFASENSLLNTWTNELRNVEIQQDRLRFRRNMERIGEVAAYEISKLLSFKDEEIKTPLGIFNGKNIETPPVLSTILRAGVPLFQGLLNYFDKADCGFVAAYRKHNSDDSFEINQQYITCPDLNDRVLILADPMLATGASLITALEELQEYGKPKEIHIVVAIASTVGVEMIISRFPDVHLWIASIDDELTAKGYIVPGLGDAGDLAFGPKLQF